MTKMRLSILELDLCFADALTDHGTADRMVMGIYVWENMTYEDVWKGIEEEMGNFDAFDALEDYDETIALISEALPGKARDKFPLPADIDERAPDIQLWFMVTIQ